MGYMSKLFGIKKWFELTEDNKSDTENLGWTSSLWDKGELSSFILNFSWDEVTDIDYKFSITNLGFTKDDWDDLRGMNKYKDSLFKSKLWDDLSEEERLSAENLGWNDESWNKGDRCEMMNQVKLLLYMKMEVMNRVVNWG